VTGRSGGGSTSWWVGAIDERIAAVAPVAGITDLEDHVVGGAVEGHCDCMYFCNTYRWDFPILAALVAPRPMLVENTDKDPIFPEGGVRRVYAQAEKVYAWYGAADRLGLVIGKGGHVDSAEIRHPSFAFFERWLKPTPINLEAIEEPDRKVPIEALRVLRPGELPPYARNGVIQESFVAQAPAPPVPESPEAWESLRSRWLAEIRTTVFAGWPSKGEEVPIDRSEALRRAVSGGSIVALDFTSQPGVRLRVWCLIPEDTARRSRRSTLVVLDQSAWDRSFGPFLEDIERGRSDAANRLGELWPGLPGLPEGPLAFVAPRGVGPTAWPASKDVHIRRRFALIGQTLDGMRAWDIRRAITLLRDSPDLAGTSMSLTAAGQATSMALWAAVFEPDVASITLLDPPTTWRDGPAFASVGRVLGMPQAAAMLHPRPLTLIGSPAEPWSWTRELGRNLTPDRAWPRFAATP
jgi:hypothetical protein